MLYQILSVADAYHPVLGPGAEITLPLMMARVRLAQSKRRTKCRTDGEWEYSARPGAGRTGLIVQGVMQ